MTTKDFFLENLRGVCDLEQARRWMDHRGINDIECMTPDQAGVPRGKIMPTKKFFSQPHLALPLCVFYMNIAGGYNDFDDNWVLDSVISDSDMTMVPDFSTLCMVPWEESDPTAQVIHDAYHPDGRMVGAAPRSLLRRIIGLYEAEGWEAIVAPELEFYLVEPNIDPNQPLRPPTGRSGRPETGRQSYSISAVNEFDDLFEDIYNYSEAQGLEIDTLMHEDGPGQIEINLRHGAPLQLADQVFLFKRSIREAGLKHKIYATFMAKPIAHEPGSAMHIHSSVIEKKTGRNIFSNADGTESDAFRHFIGGLQAYMPSLTCMFAPYVNSYRRLVRSTNAPINVQWGYDNRTAGLRVPPSSPENRRVENRVPSSDANPYLAIAATLAAGYLGMKDKLAATPPTKENAKIGSLDLPRSMGEALACFNQSSRMREVLTEEFVVAYADIKRGEYETFMEVISPWEREHLLLNV